MCLVRSGLWVLLLLLVAIFLDINLPIFSAFFAFASMGQAFFVKFSALLAFDLR